MGFERNVGCASTACIRVVSRATSAVAPPRRRRLRRAFPIARPAPVARDVGERHRQRPARPPSSLARASAPIFFILVSVATRISVPSARRRARPPSVARASPSVAARARRDSRPRTHSLKTSRGASPCARCDGATVARAVVVARRRAGSPSPSRPVVVAVARSPARARRATARALDPASELSLRPSRATSARRAPSPSVDSIRSRVANRRRAMSRPRVVAGARALQRALDLELPRAPRPRRARARVVERARAVNDALVARLAELARGDARARVRRRAVDRGTIGRERGRRAVRARSPFARGTRRRRRIRGSTYVGAATAIRDRRARSARDARESEST